MTTPNREQVMQRIRADLEATIAQQAKQLAEMAEAIRVKDAVLSEIAKQTPEKPDYWSSCSQCERNISDAEEALTAPPYPEILAARDQRVAEAAFKAGAVWAWNATCLNEGLTVSDDEAAREIRLGKWKEYL